MYNKLVKKERQKRASFYQGVMCLKQKSPILYNMSIMLFQKKMMNESDWKIFTKIKDKALEKYCSNCFAEFLDIIDDTNKETHEKY